MKIAQETPIKSIPQFCIYDNLFNLARDKGYYFAVYHPNRFYRYTNGLNHGTRTRNIEVYMLRDWIEEKFNIFCWTEKRPLLKGFAGFSGAGTNHNQRHGVFKERAEALATALIEILKTV